MPKSLDPDVQPQKELCSPGWLKRETAPGRVFPNAVWVDTEGWRRYAVVKRAEELRGRQGA